MVVDNKHEWLLVGYNLFAKEGVSGLKIELISRIVGKSKSSFYHHFADIETFTEFLLAHHLKNARIIAQKERLCKSIVPDLIHILLESKIDLLFNRQLRVNRSNSDFNNCLLKSNEIVKGAFIEVWAKEMGLSQKTDLAVGLLDHSLENFYLQLTEETLTYDWLANYFNQLRDMVIQLRKA